MEKELQLIFAHSYLKRNFFPTQTLGREKTVCTSVSQINNSMSPAFQSKYLHCVTLPVSSGAHQPTEQSRGRDLGQQLLIWFRETPQHFPPPMAFLSLPALKKPPAIATGQTQSFCCNGSESQRYIPHPT